MIGYLRGNVIIIEKDSIVVDVNGVGYQVLTILPYEYSINDQVELYVYTHVREDQFLLFGFKDQNTKALFLKLISVKGVGPKTALTITGSMEYAKIVQAIEEENISLLKKLPGIGNKSAQQVILDLKGKIASEQVIINSELEDALEALKVMGYKENDINKVSKQLNDNSFSTDQYIKLALKLLTK